ncbi:winged helix-turn-helix transcriptional regulator [Litorimonas sp. WD9-15]|uniref:winged helix-turn-helix transcriptional regulator n=1 Tax=Litorimonas sp. WD9-15 TaxID=3418716 RepID=UPI003CFE25E5
MTDPARKPDSDIVREAPIPLEKCGGAKALDVLTDRWTWLIVREALYGVSRFDDMRSDLDIPRSVLTSRLKKLVEDGVLETRQYKDPGARARTAYFLTEKGQALAPVFMALMQWGDTHLRGGRKSLALRDSRTGLDVRSALVPLGAEVVPFNALKLTVVPDA